MSKMSAQNFEYNPNLCEYYTKIKGDVHKLLQKLLLLTLKESHTFSYLGIGLF